MAATRPISEILDGGIVALSTLDERVKEEEERWEEEVIGGGEKTKKKEAVAALPAPPAGGGEEEEEEERKKKLTPATKWVRTLFEAFMKATFDLGRYVFVWVGGWVVDGLSRPCFFFVTPAFLLLLTHPTTQTHPQTNSKLHLKKIPAHSKALEAYLQATGQLLADSAFLVRPPYPPTHPPSQTEERAFHPPTHPLTHPNSPTHPPFSPPYSEPA